MPKQDGKVQVFDQQTQRKIEKERSSCYIYSNDKTALLPGKLELRLDAGSDVQIYRHRFLEACQTIMVGYKARPCAQYLLPCTGKVLPGPCTTVQQIQRQLQGRRRSSQAHPTSIIPSKTSMLQGSMCFWASNTCSYTQQRGQDKRGPLTAGRWGWNP
eukprot:scaffold70734_cov21-Tisochrysis_lutea.AAC.1